MTPADALNARLIPDGVVTVRERHSTPNGAGGWALSGDWRSAFAGDSFLYPLPEVHESREPTP